MKTYLIGEIGQNHNGLKDVAKILADIAACDSYDSQFNKYYKGWDAVKLTLRDLNYELTNEAMGKPYIGKNSFGETYGKHREYLELNIDEHIDIFDYVKSKPEMVCSLNNFDKYYQRIKVSLKSEYVNEAIEKIVISLKNKLQFIAHYNFMNVSTFGFLGDSIVEACNSALKTGSVKVATNMTINLSGSTQIKISENQTQKKNR